MNFESSSSTPTEQAPTVPIEQVPQRRLEVSSALQFEEGDRARLESHHRDLAELCGIEQIDATVIIADRDSWAEAVAKEGLGKKRGYTGSAIEIPAPEDGKPRVIIPGPDVFSADSKAAYKHAYEQSATLKSAIAERPEEVYRAIYLEDVAGHELSHLYQFTDEQRAFLAGLSREETLIDPETGQKYSEYHREYSKGLPIREFASCLYGLDRLFASDVGEDIKKGFLEANALAESSTGYPGDQARRTMAAARLLAAGMDREAMEGLFASCRGGEALQSEVQSVIEGFIRGDTSPDELIGTLHRIGAKRELNPQDTRP